MGDARWRQIRENTVLINEMVTPITSHKGAKRAKHLATLAPLQALREFTILLTNTNSRNQQSGSLPVWRCYHR
ncbi:MAG: hypothetical protein KDE58_28530, partial [Caldilineaceae bacterium]|nr:hypothetical protein [Caldilineaceae bacterium]